MAGVCILCYLIGHSFDEKIVLLLFWGILTRSALLAFPLCWIALQTNCNYPEISHNIFCFSGFPSQKGRHSLRRTPSWAEAVCETIPLVPDVFYPDKPVQIQVSVNHANFSDPSYVHEAVVTWVEEVRDDNFTVCVTQAGRNEKKNGQELATVDWLAYQGAPDGGVSGSMDMPTWWTGTNCRAVSLPLVNVPLLY